MNAIERAVHNAGEEGYVPHTVEIGFLMYLMRERRVYRVAEHQDESEGLGVRWRYFPVTNERGNE